METLRVEAQAISDLSSSVNSGMIEAVELIYRSSGRVIIAGIGKSAIIAQKIVATLNSTGTNAIFMHAADAIHGDLGMIRQEDIVLIISKSGNTPEIKVLVSMIKGFGNTIIGMVSHNDSYLYQQSDVPILLPVLREADPNNLAPTTSTTLQLAFGDALAVALVTLRGFTVEQFAKFHPGGSLGKQIYLKVADLVAQNEKPKVYLRDNFKSVIVEISSKRLGMTVVVDDNENIAGVITDGDLRRKMEITEQLLTLTAADLLTPNPKTVSPEMLAVEALNIMRQHSITQLVVKEGNRYKGVIHLHNIIREGVI